MTLNRSEARIAVVSLRQRIERIAVQGVRVAFVDHHHVVPQTQIRKLLAFLPAAYEGAAPASELIGMVRTARHIYKRSSDVLHGRSSVVNLPDVVVEEWTAFVDELEAFTRTARTSAQVPGSI